MFRNRKSRLAALKCSRMSLSASTALVRSTCPGLWHLPFRRCSRATRLLVVACLETGCSQASISLAQSLSRDLDVGRVPLVSETDPMVAEVLQPLRARGIHVPDLYLAIGHSPNILKGWIGLTSRLRYASACPRNDIELAIMRVARLSGASYEWAHHWPMAIRHDLTEDQLNAIDQ